MIKRLAYYIVFKDLRKCPLFCNTYDVQHGNKDFMCGISTVMENIAMHVSENFYEKNFFKKF